MIEEDYVSFETAKLLKEKGFEQECDYATSWYANQYYKNACMGEWFEGEHQIIEDIDDKCNISYLSERGIFIPAPTLQTVRKWLREKHHLHIEVRITNHTMSDMVNVVKYYWVMTNTETGRWCDESTVYTVKGFDKSEEAEEDAIRHALEKLD